MRIDIDVNRGDTFDYDFPQTNTDDLLNVWFTLKDQKCKNDADAIVQVDLVTGLLIVNGQPATLATNAAISVAGRVISVYVAASIMTAIPSGYPLIYDLQISTNAGDVKTVYNGRFKLISDVTLTISSGAIGAVMWPEAEMVLWPEADPVMWP